MGMASIVFGVRGTKFYARGLGKHLKLSFKAIPLWFGQLWCVGVGALLVCWSLPRLRGPWHWAYLWADWWLLPFFGVVCVLSLMLSESASDAKIQSLHLDTEKNDDNRFVKP